DPRLAGETDDLDEVAVELDDVARAGGLVQPVDVLGDHRADRAELLEAGHELVALVGPGRVEPAPADEAARPVPPARRAAADEVRVVHRPDPTAAVRTAVVGDAGVGGHAGTTEHEGRAGREHAGDVLDHPPSMRRHSMAA